MRAISFALTKPQLLDGSKTVTRRLGWRGLKAGDRLRAVNKCMGLRPGKQQIHYGTIEVLDVRREPLSAITDEDCAREGFPGMTRSGFVAMFCQHMKCEPSTEVARIEFRFERAEVERRG